ncbi:hypothetical protein [Massilibacteroides sp.]|uniref:hypothetical protein n=1 Tax=Massilibacteroides sp. TaxID=2034766 RepID=UPI002623F548|nr:hypothetical protein [Massilibacteroides sp.]MDD4516563.1 hypothetical protein [Massilibacteroides sp.]
MKTIVNDLYFKNKYGEERFLAACDSEDKIYKEIYLFCEKNSYKIPYIRGWTEEDREVIDIGSHKEFFIIRKGVKG